MKRAKKKLAKKVIFKHRREALVIMLSLLVLCVILAYAIKLVDQWSNWWTDTQRTLITAGISNELAQLSYNREEIINSGVFNEALINQDRDQLLSLTKAEAEKRQLAFVVVADKDGFVLARSHFPKQLGDNIFHTTAQGRLAAQGQIVTNVVRGAISPMGLISESMIMVDGQPIGAVITGYLVTDSYLDYFQKKYQIKDANFAFYTSREGIISSNFSNDKINELVSAYFSAGTDLVSQPILHVNRKVKLGQQYYDVSNIVFEGTDKMSSLGGVFIFLNTNYALYSFGMATFVVALFLIFYGLFYLLKIFRFHRDPHRYLIVILLSIFAVSMWLIYVKLDSDTIKLIPPDYTIYNSTMALIPEADIISRYVDKRVAIRVFSGGETINVVSAVLNFDPRRTEVLEVDVTGTLCDSPTQLEQSIDNDQGQVRISCIIPSPGFAAPAGTLAHIVFRPLTLGPISLEFDHESAVLANDGLATDVLRDTTDGYYQVTSQQFSLPKIDEPLPIFSPSHANSNRWYSDQNILLSWPKISNIKYHYALSDTQLESLPTTTPSTTEDYAYLTVDQDGVYYFYLQAETADGQLGPLSSFRVMVDSTPPPPPQILVSSHKVRRNEIVRFQFKASDRTSDIQPNFYIRINRGIFLPVKPPFYVPFMKAGVYTVTVRVFDRANNHSDAKTVIEVLK